MYNKRKCPDLDFLFSAWTRVSQLLCNSLGNGPNKTGAFVGHNPGLFKTESYSQIIFTFKIFICTLKYTTTIDKMHTAAVVSISITHQLLAVPFDCMRQYHASCDDISFQKSQGGSARRMEKKLKSFFPCLPLEGCICC